LLNSFATLASLNLISPASLYFPLVIWFGEADQTAKEKAAELAHDEANTVHVSFTMLKTVEGTEKDA